MKHTKIAILGLGLLCFGCANTGTPVPSASVPLSPAGRQPNQAQATHDNLDREFLALLEKHDRIGIELGTSARSQKSGAQSVQPMAERVVQTSMQQLDQIERLQEHLNLKGSEDNRRARVDVANSVASDRQAAEMSGQAFRNDSLHTAQSADEAHSNGTLIHIGTADTAGVDLGPTAVVKGGADYSQRWLETMVQHEQAMLQQAQRLAPNLDDPEVKQFADDVIAQKSGILAELQTQNRKLGAEPEE